MLMEDRERQSAGSDDGSLLGARPNERPVRSVARNLLYGILVALLIWLVHALFGLVHWQRLPGYLIIGNMMTFAGWGAEVLWRNTIGNMLMRPPPFVAYLARIPFWYLAGGIGYVLGMLVAKKTGLIGFYDIPVEPLFALGGKIGCLVQILFQIPVERFGVKYFRYGR